MLLGAALLFFLMKSMSGFFSPLSGFNNHRSDYSRNRGYRDPRRGNGFIYFLLFIVAVFLAFKMFSNGGLSFGKQTNQKNSAPALHVQPASPPQPGGIGEGEPLIAPPSFVYPEEHDKTTEGRAQYPETKEPESGAVQYIIQTDSFGEYESAKEWAKKQRKRYGCQFGVLIKKSKGQTKYATYAGPFSSRDEAESANQEYALGGWIIPLPQH